MLKARALFFSSERRMLSLIVSNGQASPAAGIKRTEIMDLIFAY